MLDLSRLNDARYTAYAPVSCSPDIRSYVLKRDANTCQYCGINGLTMHVDHIIPIKQGGKAHKFNLAASCISCNQHKKHRIWLPDNLEQITRYHRKWRSLIRRYYDHSHQSKSIEKVRQQYAAKFEFIERLNSRPHERDIYDRITRIRSGTYEDRTLFLIELYRPK